MKKLVTRLFGLGLVAAVALGSACVTGGEEGDRCNPLVHRDECDEGLVCTASTCSVFYCCPSSGPSSERNCQNLAGCPDEDAGISGDAGTDLADAEADSDARP
jgi:hypothetical protein